MKSKFRYKPHTVELCACPDCAILPGYPHTSGCDVARCPECGAQRIQCYEHPIGKPSIWTGIWPGEIECIEYDLWSKWVDAEGNTIDFFDFSKRGHWERTTVDDPDKHPALNTLHKMPLVWSRELQRWVKPDYKIGDKY